MQFSFSLCTGYADRSIAFGTFVGEITSSTEGEAEMQTLQTSVTILVSKGFWRSVLSSQIGVEFIFEEP